MKKKNIWIFLFLLPTIILFVLVYGFSLGSLFITSFTDWSAGFKMKFVGLSNYLALLSDDGFKAGLFNTIKWISLQSTIHVIIGVLVALILSKKEFYWKFVRTVYMIPNIISSAAVGLLFLNMCNPDIGAINAVFRLLGFKDFSQNWFMDYSTSFFTVTMTWLPFAAIVTILTLSELSAIPDSIIEASKIDGANELKTNIYVVIPMLKNIIGTCTILAGTSMIQKFDTIMMTTNGGPGTNTLNLPMYIYTTALSDNNFGYANSMGIILIIMGILLVLLYQRLFKLGNS